MADRVNTEDIVAYQEILKAFDGIGAGITKLSELLDDLSSKKVDLKAITAFQRELNKANSMAADNTKKLADAERSLADAALKRKKIQTENARIDDINAKKRISNARAETAEDNKNTATFINNSKKKKAQIDQETKAYNNIQSTIIANNRRQISDLRLQRAEAGKTTNAFTSMASAIRGLAVQYFGLQAMIGLFKNITDITVRLDAQEFAFKKIIKSNLELNQTMGWLSDTSKKFGVDLLTMSERYLKFRAAAETTKLTVQQTQDIFESFTKAGATLGLKTDEMAGVFLALEQMLSKSRVTTEELRRQLGERLPGAVSIMAAALGKTTSELDKMLKAGQVISDVALPKMAKMLEKVYGIESITAIDTATATINRRKTAWMEFVDALNSSDAIKVINNYGAMILGSVAGKIKGDEVGLAKTQIKGLAAEIEKLNKIPIDDLKFESIYKIFNPLVDQHNKYGSGAMIDANKATQQYIDNRKKFEAEEKKRDQYFLEYKKKYRSELEAALAVKLMELGDVTTSAGGSPSEGHRQASSALNEEISVLNALLKDSLPDLEAFNKELDNISATYTEIGKIKDEDLKATVWDKNTEGVKRFGSELESLKSLLKELEIQANLIDPKNISAVEFNKLQRASVQGRITDLTNRRGSGTHSYDLMEAEQAKEYAALVADQEAKKKLILEQAYFTTKTEAEKQKMLDDIDSNFEEERLNMQIGFSDKRIELIRSEGELTAEEQAKVLQNEKDKLEKMAELSKLAYNDRLQMEENIKRIAEETKSARSDKFNSMREETDYSTSNVKLNATERYSRVYNAIARGGSGANGAYTEEETESINNARISSQLLSEREKQQVLEAIGKDEILSEKLKYKLLEEAAKQHSMEMLRIEINQRANRMGVSSGIDGNMNPNTLNVIGNMSDSQVSVQSEQLGLNYNDVQRELKEIADLKAQYIKAELDGKKQITKSDRERYDQEIEHLQKLNDLVNASAELYAQTIENRQMDNERRYELDSIRYKDNVESKIDAEARYDKKKRKLAREQAILEKIQGVATIGIQTAIGVMENVDKPALIPWVLALGALSMGKVLATRLPAYEKGTKNHKGGAFVAGEAGQEMVKEPSGNMWLTDSVASLYTAPKGTEVIPHDETQKFLAQQAMKQVMNIVGLDGTNKLLTSIDRNTSKGMPIFDGKHLIVNKPNGTYRYHQARV